MILSVPPGVSWLWVRILPAFAADPVPNLDDLARSVRGQLLRGSSPGYDEARRVWNLAYDRRPLAIVRPRPRGARRGLKLCRRRTKGTVPPRPQEGGQ